MNKQQILATPSMPPAAPSYPRGPYRFVNREHMVLIFESDPNAIRYALPEPLEPDGSKHVHVEWIRMPPTLPASVITPDAAS